MSWTRYEGRAPARMAVSDGARDAELEDFIRLQNPQLTDVRLEQATATGTYETGIQPPRQWYHVTYVAEDGEGHPSGG